MAGPFPIPANGGQYPPNVTPPPANTDFQLEFARLAFAALNLAHQLAYISDGAAAPVLAELRYVIAQRQPAAPPPHG